MKFTKIGIVILAVLATQSIVSSSAYAEESHARSYADKTQMKKWLVEHTERAMSYPRSENLAGASEAEIEALAKYTYSAGEVKLPASMEAGYYDFVRDGKRYTGFNSVKLADGTQFIMEHNLGEDVLAELGARSRTDLLKSFILSPKAKGSSSLWFVQNIAVAETIKLYQRDPGNAEALEILKEAIKKPNQDTQYIILDGLKGMENKGSLQILMSKVTAKAELTSGAGPTFLDYTGILSEKASNLLNEHPGLTSLLENIDGVTSEHDNTHRAERDASANKSDGEKRVDKAVRAAGRR